MALASRISGRTRRAHQGILQIFSLIVTSEYDRFDKTKERLDLLVLDKDGKLIVIELKREESFSCGQIACLTVLR